MRSRLLHLAIFLLPFAAFFGWLAYRLDPDTDPTPCLMPENPRYIVVGDTTSIRPGLFDGLTSRCTSRPVDGFYWASSDTGVVAVTDRGLVSAWSLGQARVDVALHPDSLTPERGWRLTVLPPVDSLRLVPRRARIAVADTVWFSLLAYDVAGARPVDLPYGLIASPGLTARPVAGYGVAGEAPGTASVYVTDFANLPAEATVTVVEPVE